MSPELEKPLRTEAEVALAMIYRIACRKDWQRETYTAQDAFRVLDDIAKLARNFRKDPSS